VESAFPHFELFTLNFALLRPDLLYSVAPMSLSSGTKLGPYEIVAPLGAGGMGEVYRARDTRLDRDVAIKVLPAHLSANAELKQRFEREARAISSLNHPHICTLHDVGHQDGTDFLVMEHLEGETLSKRLERGPLPLEELLARAMEIADALDKAHRKGLVHRDLKPGNIMLTPHSGAKILDFGLAKATRGPTGSSSLTAAPTMSSPAAGSSPPRGSDPLTAEGRVVGTFQYMSPEQLEGKEADARSDLFALGAVLYEMATAKRAFAGKTQYSVASAILEKDPEPIRASQPQAPPALERIISRCLAKDPEDRWQTARDVVVELKWIAAGGAEAAPAAATAARPARQRLWMAAAGVLLAAALAFGWAYYRSATQEVRAVRAFIPPPEKMEFHLAAFHPGPVAVSPDGQRLAFAARGADGKVLLWVRALDALTAQPLAGTEGAGFPFWSPDGRSLGFFDNQKLKKIEIAGGPAVTLCDAPNAKGGAWSPEGVIVFPPMSTSPLHIVSAAGGESKPLTELNKERAETSHRLPQFLPDGKRFLYYARTSAAGADQHSGIRVGSIDGGVDVLVLRTGTNAWYASGHLLFLRESTLMAQRFDAKRLQLQGEAFPIAEDVYFMGPASLGVFSVSQNGVLAYQTGRGMQGAVLTWIDRAGKETGQLGEPTLYLGGGTRISPDGKRVAAVIADQRLGAADIWIHEVARDIRTRFTFDPAPDSAPVWSPDGEWLVFASNRKGTLDLYRKRLGGTSEEELLYASEHIDIPTDWSRDGRYLLFSKGGSRGGQNFVDVWALPMTGDGKPFPVLESRFAEHDAVFSPDGRWIAYVSNESGRDEIYVTSFPKPGRKWQVSTAGGGFVRWRNDGKEIIYGAPNAEGMAVEVRTTADSVEIGTPRKLLQFPPNVGGDVTGDGQRLLAITVEETEKIPPLTLVVNWTAGLKQK
jgi:Tol biopolymer transport system component